ncbi:MAG: M1 family metallopeptidase, partial [Burkholderiales bacterium]|nr:M1 family metallopeptidase [Burkholderiales bacterium]
MIAVPVRRFLRRTCAAVAALAAFACVAAAQTVPGLRLPRDVVPLAYDAKLTVDPGRDTFSGTLDITVRVLEPTDRVWLNAKRLAIHDARAVALTAPGDEIPGNVVPGSDDVVGISLGRILPLGEVKLSLAYSGAIEGVSAIGLFRQQEGERWYAVTQFEPLDARRVFPCFDEPDRKATWQLTLVVPEGLKAFANMPVDKEQPGPPGWREFAFQRTPPLPSYLVAFAVGDFDVRDGGRHGQNSTPVSIVVPKGRESEAAYAAEHTGPLLVLAERFFGAPFPFPKLDLLAYPRPTFGGAMENPGLITFGTYLILARPDERSPLFEQRFVGITAHEIAHMWFGDYVTMAWWNDLWLNESFASWLASRLAHEYRPDWPRGWRSIQRSKAIGTDRLPGARAMRQPIVEQGEVRGAFNRIVYAKGESVLAMFEQWLGPDKFREGVRRYLAKYPWGNATAEDFFAALASVDDAVVPAFRGFAERPGVPLLDVALDCSGAPSLVLKQERYVPAGGTEPAKAADHWVFPACFDFGDAAKGREICAVLREKVQRVALPVSACPQWVVANRSGIGYYLPRLSPALYAALPKADKVLSGADYESLLADLAELSESGVVGFEVTLPVAARLAASADARVASRAYALAGEVPLALVDAANGPRYAAWIRHQFGDRARELGWLPKPKEQPEALRLRDTVVMLVAVRGQDVALARKAQQLAQRWITHKSAIPPQARRTVLVAAARTSDGKDGDALLDALRAVAAGSKDANERDDAYRALGSFREPALLARA